MKNLSFLIKGIFVLLFLLTNCFALELPKNKIVDVAWLKENIANKDLIIIDFRKDKKAFLKAHLPRAIHWSTSDIRENRGEIPGFVAAPIRFERLVKNSGIKANSAIVFYNSQSAGRSYTDTTVALQIAYYYGLENTAILNGGYEAWVKEGGELEKSVYKPNRSDFKITKFNKDAVANSYDADRAVTLGNWVLIDSRTKEQFSGASQKKGVFKGGHLPNAINISATEFTENKDGIYYMISDKNRVLNILKKAGVDTSKPEFWYCNTGHLASGGWFMAKFVAGITKVTNYDGSMIEYSRLNQRKVLKSK